MAEFVVNVALIAAALVLLIAGGVGSRRRRRDDRSKHAAERRLILAAFTGATDVPEKGPRIGPESTPRIAAARRPEARGRTTENLDAESVTALLDLLEDPRSARRGMIAGLFTGPRSAWNAGIKAGQSAGRRSMGGRLPAEAEADAELYRAAARELVTIHSHDSGDAHMQYTRYAAAIGDPALAELYVRSAAYTVHAEHDEVLRVVGEITDSH